MGSLILQMIIQQLNQYIRSVTEPGLLEPGKGPAVLGNIAASKFAGGTSEMLDKKIIVSLVNITEEGSLKNNNNSRQVNHQNVQLFPVVHVNLYLLFTANFDDYGNAVDHLFRVLEFFQGRKIFKFKNAPIVGATAGDVEITLDLHTLSFEQLNDLWGSLGGKQLPFVLYRARLVPVQMERPLGREGLITEIDLNTNHHRFSRGLKTLI